MHVSVYACMCVCVYVCLCSSVYVCMCLYAIKVSQEKDQVNTWRSRHGVRLRQERIPVAHVVDNDGTIFTASDASRAYELILAGSKPPEVPSATKKNTGHQSRAGHLERIPSIPCGKKEDAMLSDHV